MNVHQLGPHGRSWPSLQPVLEMLQAQRPKLATIPVGALVALLDDFGRRMLADPRTADIEGLSFLASWLRQTHLEKVLQLNLPVPASCLDHFVAVGNQFLAARPRGLVAMWLAGNVPTLPFFSLIPALLTKNVSLLKLSHAAPPAIEGLLAAFAEARAGDLSGSELLPALALVYFDHRDTALNEAMSLAADAKIVWGGSAAVRAVTALPRQEHCTELVFGPKYSIGLFDLARLAQTDGLDNVVAAFVRDAAVFDQRACSSPQTIFLERNCAVSLRQLGERFARQFARLPAKPELDAYTTIAIANARARWALDETRDVIASGPEANWTVCLDRELALKEAVQSRTVFLTEVESWHQVLPLLSPKIQTVGMAFGNGAEAQAFAEQAGLRGVVRCVRPGLMNLYESPWDGHFMFSELVRWVSWRP